MPVSQGLPRAVVLTLVLSLVGGCGGGPSATKTATSAPAGRPQGNFCGRTHCGPMPPFAGLPTRIMDALTAFLAASR
jgi:hypothetical protein